MPSRRLIPPFHAQRPGRPRRITGPPTEPGPWLGSGRRRLDCPGLRAPRADVRTGPLADGVASDLEQMRPWEISLRPHPPAVDALVNCELEVGGRGRCARCQLGTRSSSSRDRGSWPPRSVDISGKVPGGITIGLDAARSRLQHHRLVEAVVGEHALDVLGEHVEAVGQHDDVLLAAGQDESPAGHRDARCRRCGTSRPRRRLRPSHPGHRQ